MRLIQLKSADGGRRTGVVNDGAIALLRGGESIYGFAQLALDGKTTLRAVVESSVTQEALDYDAIYSGASGWRVLPAMDHPGEAARCLVSGTGLTHMASAKNRDAMHAGEAAAAVETLTDSMRMYRLGVEGGRPAAGEIGAAPEWFYKGNGLALRAHGEPLDIPPHAEDGGEEPEIAGVYVIDGHGGARRAAARGNGAGQRVFRPPL